MSLISAFGNEYQRSYVSNIIKFESLSEVVYILFVWKFLIILCSVIKWKNIKIDYVNFMFIMS